MISELERVKRAIHEVEHRLKTEPDHNEHLILRREFYQLADLRDQLEEQEGIAA